MLNNFYTNWGYYALGARVHGKIISESNAFVASRRVEVTPWFAGVGTNFDQSASILSSNNLFVNGTTFHEFILPGATVRPPMYGDEAMNPPVAPTHILNLVMPACAGALFGEKLRQCSTQNFINMAKNLHPN